MKATLIILFAMSAMCAVGAAKKPTAKKTSFSAAELRTLATSVPTVKNASMLHSVAMATSNNVERKQEYLKAAAACLIACDKEDIYTKHIKGKLQNAMEFEGELKDDCRQCSGLGSKDRRCSVCNGSGRCSSCKGTGQVVTRTRYDSRFNKYSESKPCSKCNESGRCNKCGGAGTIDGKCVTCAGTGKALSKEVAERVFRDSCNALADVKNGKVHTENNSKEQVKTNVKELYAQRCKATGGSAQVNYGPAIFGIVEVENNDESYNFIVTEVSYSRQPTDWDFAVLPPNCSPDIWYLAVEECAEKIKEWVRVAKGNMVEHVEKEIPIDNDVKAYPGCITAGKGQGELFKKATRASYSQYAPESVKFIGSVEYSENFERFHVAIFMKCGENCCVELFAAHGSVEDIDKRFEEFLVFANPMNLIEAREEQAKKEDLFH